jgi:RHS repeat-associated protein
LLDTSGNVVADFHYDAWGVRTASGPAAGACPFGFAGMFQDATTGLYYAQARWYSAPQGRFLTRDPSGESGGLNLYAYCGNDPVNQTDSTGLAPDADFTLSLSGSDPGVYLPPSGGPFDLSPTPPDPYASLVTPAMTGWWQSQPGSLSPKQVLALDFARKIDLYQRLAQQHVSEGSSRLVNATQAQGYADLEAGLREQVVEAQNGAKAAQRVADGLIAGFNQLGLSDVDFSNVIFNCGDVYLGMDLGEPMNGLQGAIRAAERAASPHYTGAVSTGDEITAIITFLTWGESSVMSKLLSASLPGAAVDEAAVAVAAGGARVAGELYGAERLEKLAQYLAERDVELVPNADALLDSVSTPIEQVNARLQVFEDETAKLYLRSDPTRYEVWHELGHYLDFRDMGYDAFIRAGDTQLEQNVYDLLRSPRRWPMLDLFEQDSADLYVLRRGGRATVD